MILNGYAILDAFITSVRLGLAVLIVYVGFSVWRSWNFHLTLSERHHSIEATLPLVFQLAVVLFLLNVASWPIFYLMLLSYVPEWPGVMCIYGVTQIGAGSMGTARFLPSILEFLQATKPVLVFLSGAWLVLHLLNRRTRTAPLTSLVLAFVLGAGLVALCDGLGEMAYLTIPKKEEFPSSGCCTTLFRDSDGAGRFLPRTFVGDDQATFIQVAYFSINSLMVLGLGADVFFRRKQTDQGWLGALVVTGIISVFVNWLFLVGVAAPLLLHLPDHQCPYDLISVAPGSILSAAVFVCGFFCVGWAGLVRWLGSCEETKPFMNQSIHRLLFIGFLGYIGSLLIMIEELARA